jgi:hypothetical protein
MSVHFRKEKPMVRFCAVVCFVVFAASLALTQASDPVVSAQAPILGSDHHYIGIGAETVNPADGSLSFDLPLTPPVGRRLSMPFGISYLSSDQFHPYATGGFSGNAFIVAWKANQGAPLEVAGWSYHLLSTRVTGKRAS